MIRAAQHVLVFLVAVVCAAALGSLVQSQFNLAALQGMGVPVPLGLWIRTSLQDLIGFAPIYAIVVAVAYLVAFPIAGLLARRLRGGAVWLYALAGGAGILLAILLINAALPMTPLAVTRYALGTAALSVAGAIGGLIFARLGRALSGQEPRAPAPDWR
ncbi:MAG: hypothetical protein JJT90_01835 [Ectothiorhodospiraceae bacterium]|nr:hypothetical protein [Ectothiorhodospiraceae bacterium]